MAIGVARRGARCSGERHPNGAICVHIEGFRPCWSKLSYGATQKVPMIRLLHKERLKSPHKPPFYVTGPFGSFWSFLAQHSIFVIFSKTVAHAVAISEPGWAPRKKVPFVVLLKLTWRSHTRRWSFQIHHCAEIKFECRGCSWWGVQWGTTPPVGPWFRRNLRSCGM